MSTHLITLNGPESRRTTVTPLPGELLVTTDEHVLYVGDGSTPGGVKLTSGDTTPAAPTITLKTKTWNMKTVSGQSDYSPVSGQDALIDPSKGIYIVFLSAARLVPEDYTINATSNKITLSEASSESDLDLTLYYIGEE